MRAVLFLCVAVSFAGCVVQDADGSKAAPTRMAVADGNIIIGAPRGYCVDTAASHDDPGGAFVLLGSCAALSGSTNALRPQMPGVLTASVAAGITDENSFAVSIPSMAKFLASEAGRAALSRSGDANTVRIIDVMSSGNVMLIHAEDSAPAPGQDLDPDYWRAIMPVNNRIVTLSVLSLRGMPLAPGSKKTLLEGFFAKVQLLNGKAG